MLRRCFGPRTFRPLTGLQGHRGKQSTSEGAMASVVTRAYNGSLGAEPPAGPGQTVWSVRRAKPPEAESFFSAFGRLTESANLPY